MPFLFLGHIYRDTGDLEKARKCYRKCYQIDPGCTDAARELSDILRKLGAVDANLSLLRSITSVGSLAPSSVTWAHLRLGVLHLSNGEPTSAIVSLQSAIRGGAEGDVAAWESLADAYRARGSHTAAMKAYEKVLKMKPDSVYAELQIAGSKLTLGHYAEAVDQFSALLAKQPDYVPALKGLAEAFISQVKVIVTT